MTSYKCSIHASRLWSIFRKLGLYVFFRSSMMTECRFQSLAGVSDWQWRHQLIERPSFSSRNPQMVITIYPQPFRCYIRCSILDTGRACVLAARVRTRPKMISPFVFLTMILCVVRWNFSCIAYLWKVIRGDWFRWKRGIRGLNYLFWGFRKCFGKNAKFN